jgi:hypothetical protein
MQNEGNSYLKARSQKYVGDPCDITKILSLHLLFVDLFIDGYKADFTELVDTVLST